MAPGVLKQALSQSPFRPVKIFTGGGTSFEIKSREFCVLSPKGRTLVVFTGEGTSDDEQMRLVDVFLITKLETEGRGDSFNFSSAHPGSQET